MRRSFRVILTSFHFGFRWPSARVADRRRYRPCDDESGTREKAKGAVLENLSARGANLAEPLRCPDLGLEGLTTGAKPERLHQELRRTNRPVPVQLLLVERNTR